MQDRVERGEPLESFSRLRNRLDANISQQLGNGGNLYLNGSSQRYWSGGGRAVNFSVGYSNQWRDVSYSISAQRLRSHYEGFSSGDKRGETSTLFSLNLSIPLGGGTRVADPEQLPDPRQQQRNPAHQRGFRHAGQAWRGLLLAVGLP